MDWFKMRTSWGASVDALSDAEAGRFIKAVYAFMRSGDDSIGSGREAGTLALALDALRQDLEEFNAQQAANDEKKQEIAEKRRKAAMTRWSARMQTDANACKRMHVHANASTCMQVHDFASPSPSPGPLSSPPTTPPIIPHTPSHTPREEEQEGEPKNHIVRDARIGEIVDFLNARAGTHYKASSEVTRKHIRARMTEGFTVEDFQTVIRKKCDEWKGTEMEKFLRPETLFGTKFESYLNAPSKTEPADKGRFAGMGITV